MTPELELLQQAPWARNRYPEDQQSAQHHSVTYVRYDGLKLVGMLRLITDETYLTYLCDLIVDERYRRQGVGRSLMEQLVEDYGHTTIVVISGNAGGFYQHLGFERRECWVRKGSEE